MASKIDSNCAVRQKDTAPTVIQCFEGSGASSAKVGHHQCNNFGWVTLLTHKAINSQNFCSGQCCIDYFSQSNALQLQLLGSL